MSLWEVRSHGRSRLEQNHKRAVSFRRTSAGGVVSKCEIPRPERPGRRQSGKDSLAHQSTGQKDFNAVQEERTDALQKGTGPSPLSPLSPPRKSWFRSLSWPCSLASFFSCPNRRTIRWVSEVRPVSVSISFSLSRTSSHSGALFSLLLPRVVHSTACSGPRTQPPFFAIRRKFNHIWGRSTS